MGHILVQWCGQMGLQVLGVWDRLQHFGSHPGLQKAGQESTHGLSSRPKKYNFALYIMKLEIKIVVVFLSVFTDVMFYVICKCFILMSCFISMS